jgi:methylmalonyl-CoA mutase C-terminal domain/subunit
MQRKIRVLVGKPGLDGHDRGAKVVAAALRDAGMEVIYTGLHQTPEQIVEAAVQEDVDVVALSILSGAHMTLFPDVQALLRERGVGDKLLTGGGIIPPEDMETLAREGVGKLFGPGSSTQDIVAYIRGWFAERFGPDALTPLPAAAPARALDFAAGPLPDPAPRHHAAAGKRAKPGRAAKPAVKRAKPAKAARPAPKQAKPKRAAGARGPRAGASARRGAPKRAAGRPARRG